MTERLEFQINEGRNRNYFIQDENVNAHIVVTEGETGRIYTCFPENNSGIGIVFENTGNAGIKVKSPLESSASGRMRCVSYNVSMGTDTLEISSVCMDSIRVLRELKNKGSYIKRTGITEPAVSAPEVIKTIEKEGVITRLVFERASRDRINNYYLSIELNEGCEAIEYPGAVKIRETTGKNAGFRITCGYDGKKLEPLSEPEILNPDAVKFCSGLNGVEHEKFSKALRNLRFLSYDTKLLAGSWRFLTYFGRDTMLTALLMNEVSAEKFKKVALQSVIDRIGGSGSVAHEEDIGCQAAFRHLEEMEKAGINTVPENISEDVYDYKMVDDDFMVSIAIERLLGRENGRIAWFLKEKNRNGRSNLEIMAANINYCLGKIKGFDGSNFGNLVRIQEEYTGDWRDSWTGLGYGKYPVSINCGLVEYFIESALKILGECSSSELSGIIKKYPAINLLFSKEYFELGEKWKKTTSIYRCSYTADEMKTRLRLFIEATKESEEKEVLLGQIIENEVTVREFLYGNKVPEIVKNGIEFPALSLDADGNRVEVMNSDISFRLFFGRLETEELESICRLLELPYPMGLRTDVGIVVANPAYSLSEELWGKLDKNGYHGTVVWSWQNSMIQKGLMRQIEFMRESGNDGLVKRLSMVLDNLRRTEKNAGELVNSELWTYKTENGSIRAAAYGSENANETESNAVQLWSASVMSVMYGYFVLTEKLKEIQ